MPRQTFLVPTITGDTVDDLRHSTSQALQLLMDRLDQLAGTRGTPTWYADVQANGSRIHHLGLPESPDDAQRVDCCLHRDTPTGPYDAGGENILNVKEAVEGAQAVNLEQVQRLLGEVGGSLLHEPFVTVAASALLLAERVLTAEVGVLALADAGANSTVTVSIAPNGVSNAKLRQGAATSVMGRSANSLGNVADIAAADNTSLLRRAGDVLGFGTIDTTYLSSYVEDTFTVTGTGFAADPTGTARYVRFDTLVLLFLPELTGTSDATTFTLTGLPAAITPTRTSHQLVLLEDNGTHLYGVLRLNATSTTIDLFPTAALDGWTAAGDKTCFATVVSYVLL